MITDLFPHIRPAEISAAVAIPANRPDLGSCRALMAVRIALGSDITRLPVTTQAGMPDLRSPNPWGVAEGPFWSGDDIGKVVLKSPNRDRRVADGGGRRAGE